MSFNITNFLNNDDIIVKQTKGCFSIVEYKHDLSVTPLNAMAEYFNGQMNVRKRQLVAQLDRSAITLQQGAMQWVVGDINATTGLKGAGDFFKKALRGSVTGESAIKPEYKGTGMIVSEPTYRHLIIIDLDDWNRGILVEDGMYLASDAEVEHKTVMRSTVSSATLGNESLFNLGLFGTGFVVLESDIPEEELVEVELHNDTLKIDGSLAIAWSESLTFTVERSGKSLIGSAASGEGLVNVYRGTGRVLMKLVS
ncbi:AIM24 family protein [uncultured Streptococcus sp.]|uniref:AIM24 family protein n=1 Tax=uncultured Streptococcus sp. TaxID=83427 RepID=UPI0027DB0ED4|nr:AIM24 family protein [uncultured Streptococcus sp.]